MRAPALHFLPAFASVGLLLGSAPALAGDTKPMDFHHAVAVRYGTVKLGDVYLQDVFGKQNDVIKVEYSLGFRLFEFNLAAGFGQAMGWLREFQPALFDYLRRFKTWKVPDEAKLTCRIQHALIALRQAPHQQPHPTNMDLLMDCEKRLDNWRLQ